MQKRRKRKFDTLVAGLFTGLLLPVCIFTGVFLLRESSMAFSDYLSSMWRIHALVKIASLCVLPNVAAFWVFLSLKFERAARGVLGATLLYAFLVLISRAF